MKRKLATTKDVVKSRILLEVTLLAWVLGLGVMQRSLSRWLANYILRKGREDDGWS